MTRIKHQIGGNWWHNTQTDLKTHIHTHTHTRAHTYVHIITLTIGKRVDFIIAAHLLGQIMDVENNGYSDRVIIVIHSGH